MTAKTIPDLNPREQAALLALNRYSMLTNAQVQRLFFAKGSASHARECTSRLLSLGLVQRFHLPHEAIGGRSPSLFRLDRQGHNYLRDVHGIPVPYFRHSQVLLPTPFLKHAMAVNDILIAAELFARQDAGVTIAELRNEHQCKQTPMRVEAGKHGNAEAVTVVPDAFMDIYHHRNIRTPVLWECDRSTEEAKRWRGTKVRGYTAAHAAGVAQSIFNTDAFTVATVAMTGIKRRQDLLRWTERELEALGARRYAPMFLFTVWEPDMEPATLFLEPRWYMPFGQEPVALLEPDA